MSFVEYLAQQSWDEVKLQIFSSNFDDVKQAITTSRKSLRDIAALMSPAADELLEEMAQRAAELTRQRFGYTLSLFAPLYLSNLCANECTYCGFTMSNKIKRKTLSLDEIRQEAQALKKHGFESVLLVTGEHERKVGMEYFLDAIAVLKDYFPAIALEVQPLSQKDYLSLKHAGVNSVLVYQETYHRRQYAVHHQHGRKQDFDWRLTTPERLGRAGVAKIGLGALLGLSDCWRTDSVITALHVQYLQQHFWRSRYSISFPRLRSCVGNSHSQQPISDRQLVQLICAQRIIHPDVELSLSTREAATFRDNLMPLGITHLSAGSKTQPGGYSDKSETALAQFDIEDQRAPAQVAQAIKTRGFDPVWQDWLPEFC
ncbi:MAG: 2-iminoacetate synthase ThiH [Aestuariibacter sp.]